MSTLSIGMQQAFLSRRRRLCWMFWVEGVTADLYAWSGVHTLSYDGHSWRGVGHVAGMETIRKNEGLEHVEQKLSLSGLDPSALTGLDQSVRGLAAKVWLGALDDENKIIDAPLLLQELVQDTLSWDRAKDDTITLSLACFEALPFVGRATGRKWSYEAQLDAYAADTGFYFNAPVSRRRGIMDWRLG
ncbi:MAG: hypothetical protein WC829_02325 [Hyphomicrobium sp.]|jgi:hypothetical protein